MALRLRISMMMMIHYIRDYDVLRSGTTDGSAERSVIAILIERRRGRLPVGPVKVSGQGDLEWTAADGRLESIGLDEFPVEADVMAQLWSPAGLVPGEVDREGEPTGEQLLKLAGRYLRTV